MDIEEMNLDTDFRINIINLYKKRTQFSALKTFCQPILEKKLNYKYDLLMLLNLTEAD